jgi:crooked neck
MQSLEEEEQDFGEGGETADLHNEYKKGTMVQMKVPEVNDRSRNAIQITAEQILKDPHLHDMSDVKFSNRRIMDEEELKEHKGARRKEFEDKIRKQKYHMGTWIKYAQWEEGLEEFRRARSVFERALDIDYKNISLWLKYVEMEMRNKFPNHARNIWERATKLLPRVDQFWFKYIYMEEMLGNYVQARRIFDKWMTWKPGEKAWMAYVKFEERMNEPEKCRAIMYKYLDAFPKLDVYLKVARFEARQKHYDDARFVYEKALEDLGDETLQENFFIQWAKFEVRAKEFGRARQIFRYGLDNLPRDKSSRLHEEYLKMEKQFGQKEELDQLVIDKRRRYYMELLEKYPQNYDAWFDLLFLETDSLASGSGDITRTRDTFEKAISQVPPSLEKRLWRRYIYLWVLYATFEELDAKDNQRTKTVFERVARLVPHKDFTFSHVWIQHAHFLLRQKDLTGARKVFGLALGMCPQEKIFQAYIELEMQLTNFDRCRALYDKYLLAFPDKPNVWIQFAGMEQSLEEFDRARAILKTAIGLPVLNMPEVVWKTAIDLEISLQEYKKAKALFETLLLKTRHPKVYLSYADFLIEHEKSPEQMRELLTEGDKFLTGKDQLKEQRKMLLEGWLQREITIADPVWLEKVRSMQPRVVRKQRRVKIQAENEDENEEDGGWEEYLDYIFKDDNPMRPGISNSTNSDGFKNPNIMKIAYMKKAEKEKEEREKHERMAKLANGGLLAAHRTEDEAQ